VKVKVERSGGFAGISSSNEMDVDNLPPSIEGAVRALLDSRTKNGEKLPARKILRRPKGAADHLNYKITIQTGEKDHVIECDEFDMNSNLKSLVNYVQKNSKKRY
jgi:hypothetical protein